MAGPKLDREVLAHLEWLGFVRPIGLVVSAPALVRAGAILDRRDSEGQRLLRACVEERMFDSKEGPVPCASDFRRFAESVLGWSFSPKGYAGTIECPMPTELEVPLPEYSETLKPDFAVRELEPKDGASAWQLLVRIVDPGEEFDRVVRSQGQLEASAHGRMERLLRQTNVPAGILFNGHALRLVSAPRGESSGWLDFRVADMIQTAGRPISTAMRLLLRQSRLLAMPRVQRLAALLDDSRKFQNEVSERLAEQVLHALYEFLRGFQAAHDASKGQLLREPLTQNPDEVYRALLTVILRLVFLLYAEERDMLPEDETFLRYYSLAGLYERLREDAALFPDTMDQRYGAWAQLLVLFRMIHDGAEAGAMRLPKRHGVLFDPDRFIFLEGRPSGVARNEHSRIEPPLVPDGTVYRALEKLLVLDSERISYRALDVEQIGSVYETMMGFRLETTTGRSIAVKAQKKQGAPTALDLEALLAEPAAKREKWIQDRADRMLPDTVKKAVVAAATVEDLHAVLSPVIDHAATPDVTPRGAMVLQPSEERRRSGSHYTPRALTEPIVRTTLEPILIRLRGGDGQQPRPAQILDLKICDPAMGSGAFLVEACRQLGDALVDAWHAHGEVPMIPPDEDEVVFARRLIAQRCLYGVDRNPVAVDLAKVSLWLITLAKEHALTFVDHALRHGDSLVGLSRKQIEAFHWEGDAPRLQAGFETMRVREHAARVSKLRRQIWDADENISDRKLRDIWHMALFELGEVRLFGDLVLAAFFGREGPKEREAKRSEYANAVVSGEAEQYRGWLLQWRHKEQSLAPFHWEIEFPEVFERENMGFDAIVGNPPFAGKNTISKSNSPGYLNWLKLIHLAKGNEASVANADLVAHFFRRAFGLLRKEGTLGFVATNTVYQGDSRRSGLSSIASDGGIIYSASRRMTWPGRAAVVVCIIHIVKSSSWHGERLLGKTRVRHVSPFLIPVTIDGEPQPLMQNNGLAFKGCEIGSLGFLFSAEDVEVLRTFARPDGTPLIKEYIGGSDLNAHPVTMSGRFIIDSDGMREAELPRPAMELLRSTLLSDLEERGKNLEGEWWHFRRPSNEMRRVLVSGKGALALARVSSTFGITHLDATWLPNSDVILFDLPSEAGFCLLQSRCHELWSFTLSGTMKDDLRYAATDCFAPFPFPSNWKSRSQLVTAGRAYFDYRSKTMQAHHEGLTQTYNRFHAPDERDPDIEKLREMHSAIDRAVLDAYGWSDISTDCEFLLDYEIDEEEWGDKKKPYRYRWPDEVRDQVLARLLELNAERAKEEVRAGTAAVANKVDKKTPTRRAVKTSSTEDLFS